jgi:hypothetical protein
MLQQNLQISSTENVLLSHHSTQTLCLVIALLLDHWRTTSKENTSDVMTRLKPWCTGDCYHCTIISSLWEMNIQCISRTNASIALVIMCRDRRCLLPYVVLDIYIGVINIIVTHLRMLHIKHSSYIKRWHNHAKCLIHNTVYHLSWVQNSLCF